MCCNRLRLDWQYEIRKWRIWWNTKCVHYIFHEKSRKITARAAKIGIFHENSRTAVVWNSLSSVKIMKKKCRFHCKNHRVKMQFVGCRENVHIICYIIRCKEWYVCWTQEWTNWNAVWVVDFGGPRELCIRWAVMGAWTVSPGEGAI